MRANEFVYMIELCNFSTHGENQENPQESERDREVKRERETARGEGKVAPHR